MNNVSVRSQLETPGYTSTPDIAQYHLEQNLTVSCLCCWSTDLTEREIPMQYYAIMEMYADKCMESQVCNDFTYKQNSVSEVLSENVMLSIYFRLKVLNTLQNNMNRIFRVVLFIMPFQKTCLTFSLCDITKIYLFVFQFKIILNFAHLISEAV